MNMKSIKTLFLTVLVCILFSAAVLSGCTARSTSGEQTAAGEGSGSVEEQAVPSRPVRPDTLETRLEEAVGRWFDAPLRVNSSMELEGGLYRYEARNPPIMSVQAVRLDESIPVQYPVENWLVLEAQNVQYKTRFYEVYSHRDLLRFSFSDGTVAVLDDNYLAKTDTGYSKAGDIPVLAGQPMYYGDHIVTCYLVLGDGTYVAGKPNRLELYGHLVVERAPPDYGIYGDH